jgi:PQ loop repeat
VGVLIIYTFHKDILENDYLLVAFNGLLWIPQIIKNYRDRSRIGPDLYFIVVLSISHVFFPVYLKGCPSNLFGDKEPNYLVTAVIIAVVSLQAYVVKEQQKRNPRFFVPKRWRRRLNTYNYFHEFKDTTD